MRRQATTLGIAVVLLVGACGESATSPSSTVTSTTTTTMTVPPTSTTTSTTTTTVAAATTTTTAPAPDPSLPGWDTWTLIYASLESATNSQADAEAIAATVAGSAVLLSDNYPSLNPGYWVVYSGEWGSRREAGVWCPESLAAELTCYPRYLGWSIPALLRDGAGLAQLDAGRLVALDLTSGEVLATFSDDFHWEAEFPSSFNLTSDAMTLYFGMGWEDSWYSCESDGGEVWRLNLDTGVEDVFSPGWSPAISPDGRYLAVVVAGQCFPDPEVDGWVVSPGSQVEVFDLADGDMLPDYVLATAQQPTSYEDPFRVLRVTWDPARGNELLIALADGSVRRTALDSKTSLTKAPVEVDLAAETFAVASIDHFYTVDWDGEETVVTLIDRDTGAVTLTYDVDGWVTGFASGGVGQVIITTWDYLIPPFGIEVPVEGGVNNLDW